MITWVRPLKKEDIPAVLAIEMEANPSPWRVGDFLAFAEIGTLSLDPTAPDSVIPGGEKQAWVFADPEVRGFICVLGVSGEAELQSIAVEKVRWNGGIGSALMETISLWAKKRGISTIHLEVRESNLRAIEFYGRKGFLRVGHRPKYYADNGEGAILMSLLLGSKP